MLMLSTLFLEWLRSLFQHALLLIVWALLPFKLFLGLLSLSLRGQGFWVGRISNALRHLVGNLRVRNVLVEVLFDLFLYHRRLHIVQIYRVQVWQNLRVYHWGCQRVVVHEHAPGQRIFLLLTCLRELHRKRALGWALSILLLALVSRLSLLTTVAIENIHAITVRVQALCSLGNQFYVLRGKNLVDFLSDLLDVLEGGLRERGHVNVNLKMRRIRRCRKIRLTLQLAALWYCLNHLRSLVNQTKVSCLQQLLSFFKKFRPQLQTLEFVGPRLVPQISVDGLYLWVKLVHFHGFNAINNPYLLDVPWSYENLRLNCWERLRIYLLDLNLRLAVNQNLVQIPSVLNLEQGPLLPREKGLGVILVQAVNFDDVLCWMYVLFQSYKRAMLTI